MLQRNHFKTIVVSDIHLGTTNSKAKEVVRFLKNNTCETLILNGDIIDGWQLRKGGQWKKKHTRFFRVILKMIEKYNTKVIYVRGNHDDFLDHILPFEFAGISIVKDYIYESFNKRYLVIHGDIFDAITTNLKWLAKLGDTGYTFLLWLNKMYNNYRVKRGLPYYSLSQVVKQKVKSAVSYISDYEKELVAIARKKECAGVICGHIHHPAMIQYDDVLYLNSGDWVESLTALVEDYQGNWKILRYADLALEEDEDEVTASIGASRNSPLFTAEMVQL
ncbi:MAG TPA: UDP-2,3-diacylglucosamine diphosphatase [Bacteroidales bacterium]|nr:UDP-2,3-diacylglucosamine diphosphatase [Bacteroidales bacterium]